MSDINIKIKLDIIYSHYERSAAPFANTLLRYYLSGIFFELMVSPNRVIISNLPFPTEEKRGAVTNTS